MRSAGRSRAHRAEAAGLPASLAALSLGLALALAPSCAEPPAGSPDSGLPAEGGATDEAPDAGSPTDAGFQADGGPDAGGADAGPVRLPCPAGPFPHNGWASAAAPNGRVLGCDLDATDEDAILKAGAATLYAVGATAADFDPALEPLILVHGIRGVPADLQAVADRCRTAPFQVYVLAYNDYERLTSHNGADLADQLRALVDGHLGPGRALTLVAHSMGGIVARQALNELAVGNLAGLDRIGRVRFVGVDNPWHGYDGPADGAEMDLARPFMPDGLEDMRAKAPLFQGDPNHWNPAMRQGLCGPALPPKVETTLVFAETGSVVTDYTELDIATLPAAVAANYRFGTAVGGSSLPKLANFWKALRSAHRFPDLDAELQAANASGALDPDFVLAAFRRYYPKFPGDHTTVLAEHPGGAGFLDFLAERLGCP